MKNNSTSFLWLGILCLILSCNCCERITGWDYLGVNGKVKSITNIEYGAEKTSSGEWVNEKEKHYTVEFKFDEDGKWISERTFMPNDSLLVIWQWEYENEKPKHYLRISPESGDTSIAVKVLKVSSIFKIMEMQTGTSTQKIEWSGRRISKGIEKTNDGEDFVVGNTYDENGNLIKTESILEQPNKPLEKSSTQYIIIEVDKQGNWTKRVTVNRINENIGTFEERLIRYFDGGL